MLGLMSSRPPPPAAAARPRARHHEPHLVHRSGWLRAAVLGADDGIVSTASLLLGVAASGADTRALLVAGTAGLVAGAMSMAAGEYVSVSSQADIERADLARERHELAEDDEQEDEEEPQHPGFSIRLGDRPSPA